MLKIDTSDQIVVCDIDGVIFHSPHDPEGPPVNWPEYWADPEQQDPNMPIIRLVKHMIHWPGWKVVFLTGRPRRYADATIKALERFRIYPILASERSVLGTASVHPYVVMLPGEAVPSQSHMFKEYIIQKWVQRDEANIAFVIEDYKVNVDAIRRHAPCLLWERMK